MYYAIRHTTRFRYSKPIRENVIELRMRPRSESYQRTLEFELIISPKAQPFAYKDYLDNWVHSFDIPRQHSQLTIITKSIVEVQLPPTLPPALGTSAWRELDKIAKQGIYWDMLTPSHFTHPTPLLKDFAQELKLHRAADPLSVLLYLNGILYRTFDYAPQSTEVDSQIDEALTQRRGVCQDFAHIMIALVRQLGIPCRYVSGYLYHHKEGSQTDRSVEDATHAWVEAYLPTLGWVGFDPTNNLVTTDRHIRVAVGRDYADVPPNQGIFKGDATSDLFVGVRVNPANTPDEEDSFTVDNTYEANTVSSNTADWLQKHKQ